MIISESAFAWHFFDTGSSVTLYMALSGMIDVTSSGERNLAGLANLMGMPVVIIFFALQN